MSKKPNIILFFTDQLRADALACYGNDICKTPNLDKLATESIVFDYAYCPISVCSPSRASLMSGLYPHNHKTMINTHIAPAFNVGLPLETPTFSKVLKEHGYAMDYIGKWHVNEEHDPTEFGFDRHLEIIPDETINMIKEEAVFLDFPGGENLMCAPSKCSVEETRTGLLMDKAQQFIKERAQQEQAFFLRMDTSAPHFFNIIPEPYASMYDPESIPPWGNFDESFEGKPDGHLRKHQEWHLEDKDWSWWQKLLAFYYGDVSMQDYFVGQMLDCIKDAGIEDNTIFIFASDHGDSMGSHKHFEKGGTMYEEVMRVPLIIKMPNGEGAGTRCKEFVQLMDLMPTFIEWGGGQIPENLDARSLCPLIHGKTPDDWPDSCYAEYHGEVWGYDTQRMVRTQRWKYVYHPNGLDELYDLDLDPFELQNLVTVTEKNDVLQEMKARLAGWNEHTNDMFQWDWVKWNFPEPAKPGKADPEKLPLTTSVL